MTSPENTEQTPPYASIADFRAHTRAHGELIEWCGARIAAHNDHLNALREHVSVLPPSTEGPLRGVPVTVKDNIGVSGFGTWAGSAAALPEKWCQSGELIQRLEAAGAVVTSKSHCAEFAFGGSGFNPHHGTPRNPFDPHIHRAPGGSSSGSAVAVASGMAWIGLGTDTGGSVRVPASLCGVVGYRPSHGRWPMDGILPLSPLFDDPGIIARNCTDVGLVAAAIDRHNPSAPLALDGLKFATMPGRCLDDCERDILAAWQRACTVLAASKSQLQLVDEHLLEQGFQMLDNGPNTAATNTAHLIDRELPAWRDILSPHVKRLLSENGDVQESIVAERHEQVERLRAAQSSLFRDADFMISPTCPVGAPAVAMLSSDAYYERFSNMLLRYTVLPSLFGCCALSLPMGRDSHGIPIGLQIIGRSGEDARLIAVARTIESRLTENIS